MAGKLWIIDAFNLLRRDPRLRQAESEQGTDAARTLLESQLAHFHMKRARGEVIVLVYDGAPRPGTAASRKGLRILHPERGRTADDLVLAEARRAEGRQEVCVVTSDVRDIGSRLRGLRVDHWSAESFSEVLWPGAEDGVADGLEKPQDVSAGDVDYWLEAFGGDNPETETP